MKAQPLSRSGAPAIPQMHDSDPTVLVVEDDVWLRMPFADHLRDLGFAVFEAGTAAEAVDVLCTDDVRIDLVFSDVAMPGQMDGFGLLQWTKANRPGLPVLMTSGDLRRRKTAREVYSHTQFIDKPYDYDATVARIRLLIEEAGN